MTASPVAAWALATASALLFVGLAAAWLVRWALRWAQVASRLAALRVQRLALRGALATLVHAVEEASWQTPGELEAVRAARQTLNDTNLPS